MLCRHSLNSCFSIIQFRACICTRWKVFTLPFLFSPIRVGFVCWIGLDVWCGRRRAQQSRYTTRPPWLRDCSFRCNNHHRGSTIGWWWFKCVESQRTWCSYIYSPQHIACDIWIKCTNYTWRKFKNTSTIRVLRGKKEKRVNAPYVFCRQPTILLKRICAQMTSHCLKVAGCTLPVGNRRCDAIRRLMVGALNPLPQCQLVIWLVSRAQGVVCHSPISARWV